jgi:hypothetical protein
MREKKNHTTQKLLMRILWAINGGVASVPNIITPDTNFNIGLIKVINRSLDANLMVIKWIQEGKELSDLCCGNKIRMYADTSTNLVTDLKVPLK